MEEHKNSFSSLLFDGVRVITNVDVEKEIKEQLDNVSKIVYLPRPELQVLLHHFDWNEQNMLDALKADEKLVLKQAGIYVQNEDSSVFNQANPLSALPILKEGSCLICLQDQIYCWQHDVDKCAHRICENCWYQYLKIEIEEKKNCIRLECPKTGCKTLLEEHFVSRIFKTSPQILINYRKILIDNFVVKSNSIK